MCVMKRSLDCNISNASFEEARMKALAAILEKIRSVGNVDTPEATECFSFLLDSHFLQCQRNQITEAVEFIRTGTGKKKTKTGHSFTQSCFGFHKLLTEDLWAQIQSCDDPSLVSALAVHMQNLGLVFASEPTYCSIGCTVAMARVLKAGEADRVEETGSTNPVRITIEDRSLKSACQNALVISTMVLSDPILG